MLWEKGLLGSKDPQTLVDTMLFMNGLYFVYVSPGQHGDNSASKSFIPSPFSTRSDRDYACDATFITDSSAFYTYQVLMA